VAATTVVLSGTRELTGPGPHAVSAGGVDLVLVRTASGPRVFQGRCPHQGALLGEGELENGVLVCRNHRWRFSVATGQREGGLQCLVACPAKEEGGEIVVDLAPLAATGTAAVAARRGIEDLPGPRGLPVLGNALQVDLGKLHLILEDWAAKYGPAYRFRIGRERTVVISDADLVQQILRARPETYRRTSKVERVFQELGVAGVFSAEGAAWRAQRRLAMEALAQRHLRGFYPTLRAVAARLRRRWEGAASRGEPLDVVEELKRFTVDVTTALAFGHDVNTIEEAGDDVIQRRLELLFPAFNRRIFALVPTWRLVRMPRDRRLDRAVAELRVWLDGLVREARARLDADPARAAAPANFLEAMITARDEAGQPFSDEVIFANLMTMLVAGEDTTAYTLAWAVHHLADSAGATTALRAELDGAVGADGVPAELDAANRLTYAGAVANETMRLRPVAPLLVFESLVDTTLASPQGDLAIPARTTLMVLIRPPVREPQRFHDPEAFRPERWLQDDRGPHDAAAHIPFGSGPRICPGRSLALLEMKVLLAMIYRCFEVTRVGSSDAVKEHFSFTMMPAELKVGLRRR
jgi:cytochrome P450/nitrite reductase/ring-hydroxylating ferredoxin subunit